MHLLCVHVQPGVTPGQIDMAVHQLIVDEYDAYPSPLGYMGFPKSLTTSVNNVVCRESKSPEIVHDQDAC